MRFFSSSFVSLLLLFVAPTVGSILSASGDDQDVHVIANPHQRQATCSMIDASVLLEPYYLLRNEMPTQSDTALGVSYAKVMTVPIPVYHMKQPARLSKAELEFSLVLVKDLSAQSHSLMNIQEVPVPMNKAQDSWFPGYYWSPLIVSCGEESKAWRHVGWKFTALESAAAMPHFYALMVQLDPKEKTGIRIGGFEAPKWMIARIGTQ